MKKLLRFLMLAVMFLPFALNAQTNVTIGDLSSASDDTFLPMNSLYEYSYTQQIYTSEEVGMAGAINSITVWMHGAADLHTIPFDIYMLEVSDDEFATTGGWIPVTSSDIVYSGTVTVHNTTDSAFTFQLSVPFAYSGTSNLLICFDNNTGQWKGGLNGKVFFADDNLNRAIYARRDGTDYDPTNMAGITATAITNSRNVITLNITPAGGQICERPNTLVASGVTAHEATLTWANTASSYQFEYKRVADTDWEEILLSDTTYSLVGLVQNTAYNARVKAICGVDFESGYKAVNFHTLISCPAPTDLAYALNSSSPTEATLSWTENGTAEAWQIVVNGDETDIIDVYTNPYTLTGLIPDSLYTAKVRAYCDVDDQSTWSSTISFEPTVKTVVGSGTATNNYMPTYTYYNYSLTEQIYTVAELGDAGLIESIDFYNNSTFSRTRDLSIYVVSTAKDTFANESDWISATAADLQFSGTVTFDPQAWTTIPLDGFAYNGLSNIAIIVDDNTGSWQSANQFLVFPADQQSLFVYNDNNNFDVANPNSDGTIGTVKNQIRLAKSSLDACLKPAGVSVSYTGGDEAEVTWTSDAASVNINVNGTVTNNVTSPYTLTGLDLSTTYTVTLQAVCDASSISDWTNPISFTTDACMPENKCAITIVGEDSYGDGWNGNTISVMQGDFNVGTFTIANDSSYTGTFYVCSGVPVSFIWNTGTYPDETSFSIYDGGNALVYTAEDGSELNDTVVFTMTNPCPDCIAPIVTVDDLTPHTATLTWTNTADSYTIFDLSDTSIVATVTDVTYPLSGLASETQYSYGVVSNCGSDQSFMSTVTFTTLISCPVPTGLAAALTPGDGTVATLNWNENGTAEAWQICLNGDETNLIYVTDTTYNLTGLTPEMAVTAKVRAYCDADDHSVWSDSITFTPTDAYSFTVNDGDATNSYVPIYGLWCDDITKSQFIIPAANLTAAQDGLITDLTFYSSNANVSWGAATFDVYLAETTETTVAALADYTSMTQVYAGSLSISNNEMHVTFNTPFLYQGGNLKVGFLQTVSGTYSSSYWYGVSATGASMGGYGTSISQRNFLPKMTINYVPSGSDYCLPVAGLTVDSTSSNSVSISWTGTAPSYDLYNGETFVANVTTTSYTFTGLSAASNYTFGVQAICSEDNSSIITHVSASTDCAAITDYPYVQEFTELPACWTVIDADGDGNNWFIYQGTIQSASYSGGVLTPDNWLISPQFAIPATGNYEVTWSATAQDQSWPAEHYGIFISTTGNNDTADFTMIQEWTLATGIFNPVIDLSNYAGQNVYIALRHWDCTDQFRLVIDEFVVREQAGANQVTINLAPNNPAYGTVTGAGIYNIGDNVTVTATASTGYTFSKWVDENNTLVSNDNPYTFVAATDLNLTAVFLDATGTTYTITVEVNDSTMGTATGAGTYTSGEQVTLTATPFAGYAFVNWTQVSSFGTNVVGTETDLIITVTGDKTFVANFEADTTAPVTQYTVTLNTADATMGSVSPAGASTVNAGSSFTATATANAGYVFVAWMDGATQVSAANPYTFTVNANTTLTATFTAEPVEPCATPTGLTTTDIQAESISITWDNANVLRWNIQYSPQGGTLASATASTNSYTISNLTPATTYQIQVQAVCEENNVSEWSAPITVTTQVGLNSYLDNSVTLYPNPAKEFIDVRVDGDLNVTNMEVYDVYGKLINTVNVIDNMTRINVSDLSNGMYFVRVTTEQGTVTKRFVKK